MNKKINKFSWFNDFFENFFITFFELGGCSKLWKIAKLLDLRVVECEPPPDGASEPISRLTGLCSTKFCRRTVTFIFYIFFRITVMFPCLNFFFKLLS